MPNLSAELLASLRAQFGMHVEPDYCEGQLRPELAGYALGVIP